MSKQSDKTPIGWFRIVLAVLLLIGCVWFIWSNSLLSNAESSRRAQAVAAFLTRLLGAVISKEAGFIRFMQANMAKIGHAMEFFLLGSVSALFLIVLRRVTAHMTVHAVSFVLAVAVADETIQLFTGRHPLVQDILIDFCGGIVGIVLLLTVRALLVRLFTVADIEEDW